MNKEQRNRMAGIAFRMRGAANWDQLLNAYKALVAYAAEIEALLAEPTVEAGALSLGALESSLIRRGIVHAAAIEDADGYDEGRTRDAILAVFEDLEQAIAAPQPAPTVEAQP